MQKNNVTNAAEIQAIMKEVDKDGNGRIGERTLCAVHVAGGMLCRVLLASADICIAPVTGLDLPCMYLNEKSWHHIYERHWQALNRVGLHFAH